ncbi:MAG: DNA polymerase IV, partial [Planctomycetota bacterium]
MSVVDDRAILHVDMDAFFASIEQLDHPELRGRPVLVGGEGRRGVVAAASYEARAFGCHSAQPMAVAKRNCPQAVVVPPHGRRYRDVSRRVFEILESFTPLVEPLSIDEAFLDVMGSRRLHGMPRQIAETIKRRVRDELGVTASVGVAPNKFLAKLASDMDKPDGLTVIEPDRIEQTLQGLPISRMWGVGPATERRLRDLGVETFGDLRRYPPEALESCLGVHARRITELARGLDHREVVPDRRAKSISQEQTFGFDLQEPQAVRDVLRGQVEQVGWRLRRHA